MAIEIVSFPIKHGDFPVRYVNVYQAGYPHPFSGSFGPFLGQHLPEAIQGAADSWCSLAAVDPSGDASPPNCGRSGVETPWVFGVKEVKPTWGFT